jgi:hypothetical protein
MGPVLTITVRAYCFCQRDGSRVRCRDRRTDCFARFVD